MSASDPFHGLGFASVTAVFWMLLWSAPAQFREAVRHALACVELLRGRR